MKHRFASCFLSVLPLTLSLLCGCGGSSNMTPNPTPTPGNPGNPAQTTNLRVVNGDGGITSATVLVNGATAANNVTFLQQTNYSPVAAGQVQLMINGLEPPNTNLPENLPANANNTLVITGCGPTPTLGTLSGSFSLVTDDVTAPAAGNFKLRIVNGAIETAGFNVFVLPAGASPSGTPTIAGVTISQNAISPYFSFAAGSYHIVLTHIADPTVLFDSGPMNFAAGQNRTYYLFQDGSVQPGFISCSGVFKPMLVADLN